MRDIGWPLSRRDPSPAARLRAVSGLPGGDHLLTAASVAGGDHEPGQVAWSGAADGWPPGVDASGGPLPPPTPQAAGGWPVAGARARRWVDAVDGGRRGLAVILVVGVLAAVLALVGYWRARPVAMPLPQVSVASARAGGLVPRVPPATARPGGFPAGGGSASPTAVDVVVDVAGRVRHPGVVRLPAGSRVVDAVRAAGGPLPGARLGLLNLAERLVDGQQVVVGLPGVGGGSPAGAAGEASPASGVPVPPVDVNVAGAAQLDTLPGVGPVLAQRIIDYRTAHGPFHDVNELERVPGIGPSTMADLRPLVTVS